MPAEAITELAVGSINLILKEKIALSTFPIGFVSRRDLLDKVNAHLTQEGLGMESLESHNITERSEVSLNLDIKVPMEKTKSFAQIESFRKNIEQKEIEIQPELSTRNPLPNPIAFSNEGTNLKTKDVNEKKGSVFRLPKVKTFRMSKGRMSEIKKSTINLFHFSSNVKKTAQKMLRVMRNSFFFNTITNLSKYHYEIINDKASAEVEVQTKKGNPFEKLFEESCFKHSWIRSPNITKLFPKKCNFVFNPSHLSKIMWDFVIFAVIFITLIHNTFERAFGDSPDFFTEMGVFNIIVTTFLFLDVAIHLNTLIYQNGIQIKSRVKILENYRRTYLIPDLICCASSFINLNQSFNNKWYDLDPILLIKLFKYRDFEGRIKEAFIHNLKSESLYKILILVVKVLLFAHFLACFWHFIGYSNNFQEEDGRSWLRAKGILEKPWTERYIYSLYWGVTTMLTVGYGDIIPTNKNEVIFNLCAMILGCGLFAYSMNHIGDILRAASQRESQMKEQLGHLRNILTKKNLPKELNTQVKKYLEFIWEQEAQDNPEQDNVMMSKLSTKLRDEVLLHTNVKYLRMIKAFNKFSEKALIRLANRMKKVRFSPEEFVYKPKKSKKKSGEKEDFSLFFIINGDMERVSQQEFGTNRNRIKWQKLKNGDYFGLHELITGTPRTSSILSLKFSSVFQLNRDDFVDVLKGFPEDYEKFCKIKDNLLLNDFRILDIKCKSCNLSDHKIEHCRLLKYSPNEFRLIGRHLIKEKKWRRQYVRPRKHQEHALSKKNYIQECQNEFVTAYKNDSDFIFHSQMYSQDVALPLPDSNNPSIVHKMMEESGLLIFKNEELFNSFEDVDQDKRKETHLIMHSSARKNELANAQQHQNPKEQKERKPTWRKTTTNNETRDENSKTVSQTCLNGNNPKQAMPNLQEMQSKSESESFDKLKTFVHYNPHNNIENVIKKLNKTRLKRLDARKKSAGTGGPSTVLYGNQY